MPARGVLLQQVARRCLPGLLGGLLLFTCACGSSARIGTGAGPAAVDRAEAPTAAAEVALRREVARWEGTPHVLGGESRSGLDCSAFVMRLYDDLFGIRLPRTTEAQVQVGQAVAEHALQPGDLVFFQPSRKTRHVGVYLSDGEFAHVSSSQGVTISRLQERYWQDAYWTARRLLPGAGAPLANTTPPASPAHAPAPTARPPRVGW